MKCTAVCPVTLAVPLAGLLALAAEQLVASLGSLRKRGLYNSPFSITLLPTPITGEGTDGFGLGTDLDVAEPGLWARSSA